MQVDQLPARVGEGMKIGRFAGQRDAGQLALEVLGEPLAVCRMVEDRVNVMENVLARIALSR